MGQLMRCAIYIRVSTEEQHINGLSLPAQKKVLTEYAESNGYIIVDYYADEGFSARKPMKYRRDLLRLLDDVKQNKIDMILVTKLDRWFRNIKDYNITEEILKAHNCYWKTIYENYDSSTANGQMVINIMLSVNQAECDRTSERIRAVLDYKRSIGEVTSGRCACYGYQVVNNRLVKDTSVSHIVEDAYHHYFCCYSIRATIRYLNNKYGDASPSDHQIDRFFKSETYAGKNRNNLNYCEPYITLEQFHIIKQITVSKVYSSISHEPYLFSSLIKCPWCGSNYTGYRRKQLLKNGGESIYIRYRCGNKFVRHGCAHLTEYKIEDYLLTHIFSLFQGEQLEIIFKKTQFSKQESSTSVHRELERLNLLFQKGRITESYYDEQYMALTQKLDSNPPNLKLTLSERHNAPTTDFFGLWQELYLSLDRAHKQAFWKSTIKNIQIDPETHQISGFNFLTKME